MEGSCDRHDERRTKRIKATPKSTTKLLQMEDAKAGDHLSDGFKKLVPDPLTAIKPTGSKPLVLERVHSFMLEKAEEFNYPFATEVMGEQAKMNLRVGSKSTVQRVLKKEGLKKSKQVIRPYLSEENKEARLHFCRIWLRSTGYVENSS